MKYLRRCSFILGVILCSPLLGLALWTSMLLLIFAGRKSAQAVFSGVEEMADCLGNEWTGLP